MKKILTIMIVLGLAAVCPAQSAVTTPPSEQKISIDYQNMEIRTVLRDVADRCELNLIIPESLSGKTSIKLREVTWKQAFQVILQPLAYTYIEDGQIVKVLPLEDVPTPGSPLIMKKQGIPSGLLEGPWYTVLAVCVFVLIFIVCHVFLFVGVLRDVLLDRPRFAPKFVWAFLVLVGGVVPLVGYWIIHHSNISKNENHGA